MRQKLVALNTYLPLKKMGLIFLVDFIHRIFYKRIPPSVLV